jgi:hypothetical protein
MGARLKIKVLILSVAVFIVSIILLFNHYSNAHEKDMQAKIQSTEQLLQSGVITVAVYDSVYSEFKRRGQTLSKSIKYRYTVDNKSFEDEKTIKDLPEEASFEITYLPSDPKIHSANPADDLVYYRKKLAEKSSSSLGWCLFITSVLVFVLVRRSYKKELEEQQEMDTLFGQHK